MRDTSRQDVIHPARTILLEVVVVAVLLAFGSVLVAAEMAGHPALEPAPVATAP